MAHKTKQHWFEHIQTHPENGPAFNNHMAGYLLGRPPWMEDDFYPAKERLIKGFDAENKDAVMFVDIAGGFGHYTEQFRSKFPDVPGRLIVQDLPVVIDQVQGLHPRIEKMGYDFLTEQPVKGELSFGGQRHPFMARLVGTCLVAWLTMDLLDRCTHLLHALRPP